MPFAFLDFLVDFAAFFGIHVFGFFHAAALDEAAPCVEGYEEIGFGCFVFFRGVDERLDCFFGRHFCQCVDLSVGDAEAGAVEQVPRFFAVPFGGCYLGQ